MGLFDSLNGGQNQPAQAERMDINQAYRDFRNDPGKYLDKGKLCIPEDVNDPEQMLKYLEQSGKVPPAVLNMARSIAPRIAPMLTIFGRR